MDWWPSPDLTGNSTNFWLWHVFVYHHFMGSSMFYPRVCRLRKRHWGTINEAPEKCWSCCSARAFRWHVSSPAFHQWYQKRWWTAAVMPTSHVLNSGYVSQVDINRISYEVWVGQIENLQATTAFSRKYRSSCEISLKPIKWWYSDAYLVWIKIWLAQ